MTNKKKNKIIFIIFIYLNILFRVIKSIKRNIDKKIYFRIKMLKLIFNKNLFDLFTSGY